MHAAEGKTLVIGLGNPIVSDDGVGLQVVQRLKFVLCDRPHVDLAEDYCGGLRLMQTVFSSPGTVREELLPGTLPWRTPICGRE